MDFCLKNSGFSYENPRGIVDSEQLQNIIFVFKKTEKTEIFRKSVFLCATFSIHPASLFIEMHFKRGEWYGAIYDIV